MPTLRDPLACHGSVNLEIVLAQTRSPGEVDAAERAERQREASGAVALRNRWWRK
jgi:hypothetical protein